MARYSSSRQQPAAAASQAYSFYCTTRTRLVGRDGAAGRCCMAAGAAGSEGGCCTLHAVTPRARPQWVAKAWAEVKEWHGCRGRRGTSTAAPGFTS
jgi:hypothetical protein